MGHLAFANRHTGTDRGGAPRDALGGLVILITCRFRGQKVMVRHTGYREAGGRR